jgi:hypothetical protein
MKIKFTLIIILFNIFAESVCAQTALTGSSFVTEIITSYGGYWQSGTGKDGNATLSATQPDNSHLLLAYVVNSGIVTVNGTATTLPKKYFSTGVNNALLDSRGIAYNATKYQALSVASYSGTVTTNTKVALGQLYDGVSAGSSSPPPASGYAQYLTDGTNGLDLGTGVANLPTGTLTFSVNSIAPAAIGDGVPDLLITQIASPSTTVADNYRFLGSTGTTLTGSKVLSANFGTVGSVGNWLADFYEASQNPMTLASTFTNTTRPLRLLAVDFADFGITSSNYQNVKQFQVTLSGDSDQAFIAYNTDAFVVNAVPLPVQLVGFTGVAQGQRVQLSWQTASEQHSAYFEVETSPDGHHFHSLGRVAAAGTSHQPRQYSFADQPAQAGLGYYRLRQVDATGTVSYSPVVTVQTGVAPVRVFPNPATDHLTVQLPALRQATLSLLAADGRRLWQQHLAEAPAQQLAVPAIASLPTGLYLLRIEVDGQATVERVAKP